MLELLGVLATFSNSIPGHLEFVFQRICSRSNDLEGQPGWAVIPTFDHREDELEVMKS